MKIEHDICYCDQCPFADVYIPWCMRYRKRINSVNIEEEKPSWCKVKKVIIELEVAEVK